MHRRLKIYVRLARLPLAFGMLGVFAASPAALAQHEGHVAHPGLVPEELLERTLPLRQGIGNLHETVTTSSKDAQAFYDQGLDYVHSFEWIEAARSFHQALRLDPNLAMAYLGLSDVYIGLQDPAQARPALEKAQALAGKLSDRERQRIEIRSRQLEYLESGGDMQKYFAYRKQIGDALSAHPEDPWLWIMRGFAEEGTPTGHGQGGTIDTVAFYQTALALSPDNFAAHHYLTHTFENLGRTQEAIEHSEAYVRLAPAIPHAHHMHGHELRRVGRTQEAVAEFRKADELEIAYYAAEHVDPNLDWHHGHNLGLLAMCYQSLGQMKSADQTYRQFFAFPAQTDIAEFNQREWPNFLLDRGRYPEALEAAQALIAKSASPMGRFAGHTAAGSALLSLGRVQDARDELAAAEREMEQVPAAIVGSLPNAGALRAELLLRDRKFTEADPLAKQIEERVRAMPGPDSWSEALFQLQSIARAAQQTGDWDLAEFSGEQMIEHDPSYAGGYYVLGLSAGHRGDAATARQQFEAAEKRWTGADSDLPELIHIRQALAAKN
jgi:tetratricopeptide (TPR) repeat protein